MPAVSELQETFEGRVEFVLLDLDERDHDADRERLGITAQAQYVLTDGAGVVLKQWFGVLDGARVAAEIETLLQT